jgi:hypothetical protein
MQAFDVLSPRQTDFTSGLVESSPKPCAALGFSRATAEQVWSVKLNEVGF